MKITWVQDARKDEAEELIIKFNADPELICHQPKFSRYVIGQSKSGNPDKKGIYFEDPTG